MLQFPELHDKLLRGLCKGGDEGQSSEHCQSLILDILCWLAGVYSNGPCRYGRLGVCFDKLCHHWPIFIHFCHSVVLQFKRGERGASDQNQETVDGYHQDVFF